MSRMFDRIRAEGFILADRVRGSQQRIKQEFSPKFAAETQVFMIQDAVNLFFENYYGQGIRVIGTWPSILPPYERMWLEFPARNLDHPFLNENTYHQVGVVTVTKDMKLHTRNVPSGMDRDERSFKRDLRTLWKYFTSVQKMTDIEAWRTVVTTAIPATAGVKAFAPPSFADMEDRTEALRSFVPVRWTVYITVFHEFRKGEIIGPLCHYLLPLYDDGTPLITGGMPIFIIESSGFVELIQRGAKRLGRNLTYDQVEQDIEVNVLEGLVAPSLFAISLLHVKNIELVETVPPPNLQRQRRKDRKPELVRFHTLKVIPMRQIRVRPDDTASSQQPSTPRSIHLVRGHFKRKKHGSYWWSPFLRGRKEQGVVLKDYDVRKPHQEGEAT